MPSPEKAAYDAVPPDPYTMGQRLCDDSGMVSHEKVPNLPTGYEPTYLEQFNFVRCHAGYRDKPQTEPFSCTGSMHAGREHILCTSPAHKGLKMWSNEPGTYIDPDGTVIRVDGTAS